MSVVHLEGSYVVDWPEAASNPPDYDSVAQDIADVYADLGTSLAIGHFAAAAGYPAGQSLVSDVSHFIADHLDSTAGAPETGSVVGEVVEVAEGTGGAFDAIQKRAAGVWQALADNPGLVSRLGLLAVGGALGATFLSDVAQAKKQTIDAQTQLVANAASKVDPAEALKILANAGPFGSSDSGTSIWTYLAVGLLLLGAVWVWRSTP